MTDARNDILHRLRARMRTTVHPPAWRSRRQFDDPVARFISALTAVKGEAYHAASLDAALDQLDSLFKSMNAQRVVVNDEPPFSDLDLPVRWPDIEWFMVGRTAGDLRAFCAAADAGLSTADAALAETGSVVISSGPGKSRLATLLPTAHFALVPTARLTTDLLTWTAQRQGPFPAARTIISGPSKTADIEQTMAIGVHGPKRFIVILYDE